jgi:methylated-DNA-protein-cysteine methyltransferase-like protein
VTNRTYQRIYAVVRRIPRGRVATYGQVAELAGLEGRARQVGYALHHSPPGLPWHRVINARGCISARASSDWGELQRHLLDDEGIEFDLEGRVDLKKFRWRSRMQNAKCRMQN